MVLILYFLNFIYIKVTDIFVQLPVIDFWSFVIHINRILKFYMFGSSDKKSPSTSPEKKDHRKNG